jgi:hypothetical protein
MMDSLPQTWRIAFGAVSNSNDPKTFVRGNYHRKHKGVHDFGTIAIIYNMTHPSVCGKMHGKTPQTVMLESKEMCQPADMLIYKEFGRGEEYSMKMPLFHFSKTIEATESGAINRHSHSNAKAQREAWAEYKEIFFPGISWNKRKNSWVSWPQCEMHQL